jgi:predicted acylesterase/phospholipase RssA
VKCIKGICPYPIVAVDVHKKIQEPAIVDKGSNLERIPLPLPTFMQDFYRVEMIMTTTFIQINLAQHPPDLLIRPAIPSDVSLFFGFQKVKEIIQAGEVAMRERLPDLLSLFS